MTEPKLVLNEEELSELNLRQKRHYQKAREAFEKNIDERDFHLIIFAQAMHHNFFYKNHLFRDELIKQPFYLVLEAMWLELGVKQGTMKRSGKYVEPVSSRTGSTFGEES